MSKNLNSFGFQLNPYDPCVANKIVDGAQLTFVWHVDNLKVSHIDGGVFTRMAEWLKKTYEPLFKDGSGAMKINRGMIHEYLGMTIDYSTRGEVKITMYNYIREIVNEFKQYDPSNKNTHTPAANHLFKVRDDQKKLPESLAQVFIHLQHELYSLLSELGLTSTQQSHLSRPDYFVPMMTIGPSWYV